MQESYFNNMFFSVLNYGFEQVSLIDSFESAIWTDRYADYGDFELYVPASDKVLETFPEDYFLHYNHSDRLMVIENIELKTSVDDGDHFIISGSSMERLLNRRTIWQQTDIDGNLQDSVERLLNENVINPSDSSRKIDKFIFDKSADPDVTKWKVTHQFTGDYLLDAIKTLCDEHDIGFKLIPNLDNGELHFSLYYGANRSYDQVDNPYILFSPSLSNLSSSDYVRDFSKRANFAYVGGEGDGQSRRFQTVQLKEGSASKWARRELFVDARNIQSRNGDQPIPDDQYNESLRAEGKKKLRENNKIEKFTSQVSLHENQQYGKDFFMGDLVTFTNNYGISSKARIVEYVRNQDTNGYKEYPTFDAVDSDGLLDSKYNNIMDSDGENIDEGVIQ